MKRSKTDEKQSTLRFETDDSSACDERVPKFVKCSLSTLIHSRNFGKMSSAKMDTMYKIPLSCLTSTEISEHKEILTMIPNEVGFSKEESSFDAYEIVDGWLHVPKYYGLHHWGEPLVDETVVGQDMKQPIEFMGV